MKRIFDIFLWIAILIILGSLLSVSGMGFRLIVQSVKDLPEISLGWPNTVYLLITVFMFMSMLNLPSWSQRKQTFHIWTEDEGVRGPFFFHELYKKLPPETLVLNDAEGAALRSWRPLRSMHRNGSPRSSLRSQMVSLSFGWLLLTLHTWNLVSNDLILWVGGGITALFVIVGALCRGAGRCEEQPTSSISTLIFGEVRPPNRD